MLGVLEFFESVLTFKVSELSAVDKVRFLVLEEVLEEADPLEPVFAFGLDF